MNTTWLPWLIVILSSVLGYGITFMAILFFDWNTWFIIMGAIPSFVFIVIIFTVLIEYVVVIEEEQNKRILTEAAKLYIERNK